MTHLSVTRNDCGLCGGIHYGSGLLCPYRCDGCGYQHGPCETTPCPRNMRWAEEKAKLSQWEAIMTQKTEDEKK
jgi:hypothetical protein